MILLLWEKAPRRIVKAYETTAEPLAATKTFLESKGFDLVVLERVSAGDNAADLDRFIKRDVLEDEQT